MTEEFIPVQRKMVLPDGITLIESESGAGIATSAAGTGLKVNTSLHIPSGTLVIGAPIPESLYWNYTYPGNTYVTMDKSTSDNDASLVFTQAGRAKWEFGATTEGPGTDPARIHMKVVRNPTANPADDQFLDVMIWDYVTGDTYIQNGYKFGVGTIPSELFHVAGLNVSAARVTSKFENYNTGAGSQSACHVFQGVGTSWATGNDFGLNAGHNYFIQDGISGELRYFANANGVSIGGSTVEATEAFRVESTTGGFLYPRLTTVQRDAMGGKNAGLTIYNSTTGKPETWDGAAWVTWSAGDVVGPASSVDNTFALFDGTTGKLIKQASNITHGATGNLVVDDGNVPAAGITSLARYAAYQQETTAGVMAAVMAGSLASHRPVWRSVRTRGTLAAPTALVDGDFVAEFRGAGYDGAATQENGGVLFIVDGAVSSGVVPMRIGFFVSATNTAGRSEKASLFSDGNFSVGSTTNTGEKVQVTGTSKIGTVTSGTWNGTAIAATYGGTGLASYTTGNYINAASASTLQQRTPAQVLTDINGVAATAVNVPATDTETSYPNNSVSTGSMTAGGPMGGGIGTHLTVESNTGNRVAQLAFNAQGGTGVPDMWLRTSHSSVGGGGFTSFYKLLHYGTFEPYTVTTVTAGYTETAAYGDKIIRCNLAAGFTVVLPSAVTSKARLTFKKIDPAGTIVLDGASTQTIDGALTISLTAQYESVTLVSDGANWMII